MVKCRYSLFIVHCSDSGIGLLNKHNRYNLKNTITASIEINGGQLTAGSYIYSLIVDNILIDSKQMILTSK